MTEKAIVLLSGGLDSTTTLAMAVASGFEVTALSFNYGQRHLYELACAQRICEIQGISQIVVPIALGAIAQRSSLTGDLEVPLDRPDDVIAQNIPTTYVPARNTIFLSYALAWAEVLDADSIFVGFNAVDYSGYPDCRPEYIGAFRAVAKLATKRAVQGRPCEIVAPLLWMRKHEIIAAGNKLKVDYAMTSSCYLADESGACGRCDSCRIRMVAFRQLGLEDPARYRSVQER